MGHASNVLAEEEGACVGSAVAACVASGLSPQKSKKLNQLCGALRQCFSSKPT